MTHTPGPWKARNLHTDKDPRWQIIHADNVGLPIVELAKHTGETHPPKMAANARLIAAAPDMLAALKRAEPWLGRLIAENTHIDCVMPNDAIRTLEMISAAIARATEE